MRKSCVRISTLAIVIPLLIDAGLPSEGPVPLPAPRAPDAAAETPATEPPQDQNAVAPVPEAKPATAPHKDPAGERTGGDAPSPGPAASRTAPSNFAAKDRDLGGSGALGQAEISAIAVEELEAYQTCIGALTQMGAVFTEKDRIEEGAQCGIDRPVEVEAVLPDVRLEPKGILRCEAALQLARMTRDLMKPAAKAVFPDKPLTAIRHASTYVCRNRNSAEDGKLSEHALGNAIDIAGLSFGEEDLPVRIARQDDGSPQAVFQRAFNALTCLYFTTVLSPGSDATHQDHMHLDVIERKGGFRYCR
jgi:hypothetical protein